MRNEQGMVRTALTGCRCGPYRSLVVGFCADVGPVTIGRELSGRVGHPPRCSYLTSFSPRLRSM